MLTTLVLGVAVAVSGGADGVVLRLVLAGASFASKQAAGLVDDPGERLQRLQGSIHRIRHVRAVENLFYTKVMLVYEKGCNMKIFNKCGCTKLLCNVTKNAFNESLTHPSVANTTWEAFSFFF